MEEYLKRLSEKRLEVEANKRAVDSLISFIAANPGASHEDLVKKSLELGHDPKTLIETALGSIKVDKSGASLNQPLEDILNEVYYDNPVPGERFVIDPDNVKTDKGKLVNRWLGGDYGVATADRVSKGGIAIPDFYAIEDAKSEADKLRQVSIGGHELRHGEDYLTRPGFKPTTAHSQQPGHHFGNIYESSELIREARDLPIDEKLRKEVIKNSRGLSASAFKRLASFAPLLAKGAVATAGGLASLASEAADSEEAGGSAEQAAFLRERDEMVRRRDAMNSASPEQQQGLSQMYGELDSGKAFDARRDALMRLRNGR